MTKKKRITLCFVFCLLPLGPLPAQEHKSRTTLVGHLSWVSSVAFSPDGKTLASASRDETIKLWDVQNGTERATLEGHPVKGQTGVVWSVAFSPNGKILASGSDDKTITLWDVKTGEKQASLKGHTHFVCSVAFSPDGKTLASGSWDKTIKLWNLPAGTERATLSGHKDWVRSVTFSPDGNTLASAGDFDKTINLWDLNSGKRRAVLRGKTAWVRSLAFSPDGNTLASAGDLDKTIKLWGMGQAWASLKGHSDWVYCVAFSPDGQTLASGSYDHTIKLWDVKTTRDRVTLHGHRGMINTVAFSPDGKMLASGSDDRTVKLWDLSAALKAEAKQAVPAQQPEKKGEAQVPKDWHKLVSKEGGFQVYLMGQAAKLKPDKKKDLTWYSAFDLAKGQSTTVGYYDLDVPPDIPTAAMNKEWQEVMLAQIAPALAKDPKVKVADLRKITAGKFAGLEATFGNADAPSVIRYLMVGKRIFILTVEARTEKEAKQLAMALFASFEVLPELTRTAEVKAPAWERFQITAGKFSVLMPGKPTLAESKGPDYLGEAPMKTFTGYHPEQAMILLALYIEVPHGIRKKLTPEDILDKYGKKGRKINLGKYPGREFEAGEGKQREILRVFVVEDRIVAVVILDLSPTQGALPRDSARYLDSLQLEKK